MKIRNAACNDPWSPLGKEMFQFSQLSYRQEDLHHVMEHIHKDDRGKDWCRVFNSLIVLDSLLHSGSVNVSLSCAENIQVVNTLREFRLIHDSGRDHGADDRSARQR
ncbi:ENTH domain-containing protein, partial [Ganoderma adspersum]